MIVLKDKFLNQYNFEAFEIIFKMAELVKLNVSNFKLELNKVEIELCKQTLHEMQKLFRVTIMQYNSSYVENR